MGGGETVEHRDLKELAIAWARASGFDLCGREIRLPASSFRADVAACRRPVPGTADPGETAVFECKRSRADLFKDSRQEAATRERLIALQSRQRELEALLSRHLPNLRHGDTLFPEYDSLDLEGFRHETIRKVRREVEALSRGLHGGTKFDRIVRYRCADFCYLVLTRGLESDYGPPHGWGVLVTEGNGLRLERRPVRLEAGPVRRLALLVSIARRAAGPRPG